MLTVAQLHQGGDPHMLKVRLDTFHALPRISRLVKKSHGAFKPSMAWLRDACYIVNLEAIQEASGFDVTCVVVRISDNGETLAVVENNACAGVMCRDHYAPADLASNCR